MSELIEIPGPGPNDPGGKRLAAVINAQRLVDDWAARRVFYARAVVILSTAMAYILIRGLGIDGPGSRFVLTLWVLAFGCLVGSYGATWLAERRVDELLIRVGGRRAGAAEPE